MTEILGRPVPEEASFYYVSDQEHDVYRYMDIYLYVLIGIVVEVVEDKNDLCDEIDMAGGFY